MTTPAIQLDLTAWLRQQLDVDASNVEASIAGTIRHLRPAPVTRDEILSHNGSLRRVLAEVDAKRRILDEHRPNGGTCRVCCGEPDREVGWDGEEETVEWTRAELPAPCPTVRLLAVPYADRPGYREEWRP